VPDHETGVASGVNNTAARIAGVLAVAVLTAVAVWQFSGALETRLKDSNVPSELVERLMGNASQLAELKAPDGTPERTTAIVSNVVAFAYIETFRVLAIVCGLLAALSGAIAWFSLGKDVLGKDVLGKDVLGKDVPGKDVLGKDVP
jgi:hypothetical protein